MGDILRQADELRRRQAEGAAAQRELVELSKKRAGEFIAMMHQRNVRPTGCYAIESVPNSLANYHRIGAGWVIEEANEPRDRAGLVLLESGDDYRFYESRSELDLRSIAERPFIVVEPRLSEVRDNRFPSYQFGDEQGLNALVWAAQRLGALPQ